MVLALLKNLFGPRAGASASMPPAANQVMLTDPLALLIAAELEAGAVFQPDGPAVVVAAGGRLIAELASAEGGQTIVRLSGGNPQAGSWAQTGGFSIQLLDEFESAASGNKITVTALVRAADAPEAGFALTYSTNEVGNAGWQHFTATSNWAAYRFDYAVPPMIGGYGDFIGVLPAPEGQAGIELALVTARVVQSD